MSNADRAGLGNLTRNTEYERAHSILVGSGSDLWSTSMGTNR